MRRFSMFATTTAVVAALCMTTAAATPPSGQFSFKDLARVESVTDGALDVPAGSGISSATYTVGPGSTTGWREFPGAALLAITRGTLTVQSAEGCAATDYQAGQAAVIPAGTYQISNGGSDPLDFVGTFLYPGPAGSDPLAAGTATPPPACGAVTTLSAGEVQASSLGQAVFSAKDDNYARGPAAQIINVKSGLDVLVSTYVIEPNTSFGWHTHGHPFLAIITRGELTYWHGHDGKCQVQGHYTAGDAYYDLARETSKDHSHIAGNFGSETTEAVAIFVNVKGKSPVPVYGNQLDATDFSPMPSPDCPKLRSPDTV